MFAWTRSLMNRASRSSSYSAAQRDLSSDARPFLLFSSWPVPSSRRTAETLLSFRLLTSATSVGLSIGTAETYHASDGSACTPPATASISPFTSFLHDPHPVPARVALPTAWTVHFPVLIAAMIVPLQTPLQSHTCFASGMSAQENSAPAVVVVGAKKSSSRRSGAGFSVWK